MNINKIIEETKIIQQDIENIQKKLENEEISMTSDTQDVTLKMRGNKFIDLDIKEDLKNSSKDKLENRILEVLQKAFDERALRNQETMGKIFEKLTPPTMEEIKAAAQIAPK